MSTCSPIGFSDVSAALKEAMAAVCTPVAVVTTMDGKRPHGTTVSAFASLSMAPPMILVALDHRSELLAILRRTRRFGLNILGSTQPETAASFARKGLDKFAGVAWTCVAGAPRLDGAPGWVVCDAASFVEAGDHTVVFADVRDATSDEGQPLTYFRRAFGTHALLGSERQ
ncbi:flavin reductase family protein [Nocardia fusca]|uniref:flavin reductase family protein n=1 Tax=Nocardia fusca TaxID=941183 RepID=UPI0037C9BF66